MPETLVHLVHPPPYGEVPFKSLGLCSVAAGLRAGGLATRLHDLSERFHRRGEDFYGELVRRLSAHAGDMSDLPRLDLLGEVLFPEEGTSALAGRIRAQVDEAAAGLEGAALVGMTLNSLTAYFAAALGRRLRRGGSRVVLGGPLAGVPAVSHLLLRLGSADVVFQGEGDLVGAALFRELARGGSGQGLAGVVRLESGGVAAAAPPPPPDLDALPRPELDGCLLDDFVPALASRGCRRGCVYCSEPGLWARHRRRDPAAVAAEVRDRVAATGIRDVHFHDDLLNGEPGWLAALGSELAGAGIAFESFFEPYGLDRPKLEALRRAGCRLVKYGVQSFSPAVLRAMGRKARVEEVVAAIEAAYELGISTHYDLLVGHPGEREEDHRETLRVVEDLYARTGDRLHFSLNPFYLAAGSAVAREPARFGVEVRFALPEGLPEELSLALAASPPYPEGYRSGVPRETTMRRMGELAEVLRRHGKDYLFLGRDRPVEGTPASAPVVRPIGGDRAARLVANAYARGRSRALARRVRLETRSDLALWPAAGPGPLFEPAGADLKDVEAALGGAARVRVLGGEPLASPVLPRLLAVARALGLSVLVETSGLAASRPGRARALRRAGLDRALVLLLATDARKADELGGVPGALAAALAGAGALAAEGVAVELGLLPSRRTVGDLPHLVGLAARAPFAVSGLAVVLAPTDGRPPVAPPGPGALDEALLETALEADRRGLELAVEDRTGPAAVARGRGGC